MKKLMLLLMVFIIPQFSFGELIFKDATDLCKNQNHTECGSPKRAVTNTTNLKDAFEEFIKYVNHLPSIPAKVINKVFQGYILIILKQEL